VLLTYVGGPMLSSPRVVSVYGKKEKKLGRLLIHYPYINLSKKKILVAKA